MKKLFMLMLSFIMLLSVSACGKDDSQPESTGKAESKDVYESVSETDSDGYQSESQEHDTEEEPDGGVLNNGGEFVGYNGNTYYWKRNGASCNNAETLANFSYMVGPSDLICISENGDETVLTSAVADGKIYIASRRIYYFGTDSSWYSVDLEGGALKNHGKVNLITVEETTGNVIYYDYNDKKFWREDSQGNRVVLNNDNVDSDGADPYFLTVGNGKLYYATVNPVEDEKFVVAVIEADMQGNARLVNTFTHKKEKLVGFGMEAVLNDGILYIGYANIQGSGMFYSFGGIVAINTLQERATEYLVRPDSETPLSHPKLRLCSYIEEGELYIMFSTGMDVTVRHTCITDGIKMLKVSTGKISDVSYGILSFDGNGGIVNGALVNVNGEGRQFTILSADTMESLGYTDFDGNGKEEGGYLLDFVSIVGDTAYISVSEISRDTSKDIGWRYGYKRDKTTVYITKAHTDEVTVLYEY